MKRISTHFAAGDIPRWFDSIKTGLLVPQLLKDVAQAFVDLQQARHEADYDLGKSFKRSEAVALIQQAENAFAKWEQVRKSDLGRLYLACFLNWDLWNKKR